MFYIVISVQREIFRLKLVKIPHEIRKLELHMLFLLWENRHVSVTGSKEESATF